MSEKDNGGAPRPPGRTAGAPEIPSRDEARDRLKSSGTTPDPSVTWDVAPVSDPAVMNAILDILFRPRAQPGEAGEKAGQSADPVASPPDTRTL